MWITLPGETAYFQCFLLNQQLGKALAETEGFEPSVRESPVRRFSKPLVSATHPRLRMRSAQAFRGKAEHKQQAEAIEAASPPFNRGESLDSDLNAHFEIRFLLRFEQPDAQRRPIFFRLVESSVGMANRLRIEGAGSDRRIDLKEACVG